MRHSIILISIGLFIFSLSMVAAQGFTVTPGQTFKVHVSVYKPAGVSFPSGGATLFAWLYEPIFPDWVCYNVGGWTANALTLSWDNEEHQENFSLSIEVAEDAPIDETLSIIARLRLDNNPIWDNSGVTVTLQSVEVNGENIPIDMQGNPSWNVRHTCYTADAAIHDVLIAPPITSSSTLVIIIVGAVLAALIIAIIVKKKIQISITIKKKK